mmetsp:Transcript_11836/g.18171  ORF Transcript_11836/g.18171 Transcript_11836/m.18171 type:complete len:94 (+) Transcript_11836:98-379(+)
MRSSVIFLFCFLLIAEASVLPGYEDKFYNKPTGRKCTFCFRDGSYEEEVFHNNHDVCTNLKKETEQIDEVGESCVSNQVRANQECGCGPVAVF